MDKPQQVNNAYFSAHADNFDTTYWRSDERNITDAHFKKPGKLLICGVGRGRTVPHLAGHTITGIDIVPEMIEGAMRYRGPFRVMNMSRMTFPDNSFDYVFAPFNTISYVDDIEATLSEVHRVMNPGGIFIFQIPNQFTFTSVRGRRADVEWKGDIMSTIFWNMFDVFRCRRIFRKARVYGRMQWSSGHSWKDRVLKILPFFDRALYFVCVK